MKDHRRDVLALDDAKLELFVRHWVGRKKGYFEVTTFSGTGDHGRDVVGFLSASRHEGAWHNYQCKQYGRSLPTETGLLELAKVLYFASEGAFTAPSKFTFVAPRGVNRNLDLFNPTKLKAQLIDNWTKYCATNIVEGKTVAVDGKLKALVDAFDFSTVGRVNLDDMFSDAEITPVLHAWFGTDIGPPPAGQVPSQVQAQELRYVGQLVDAYAERDRQSYSSHADVSGHVTHGPHLQRQRERFYAADAFKRFYRDNTEPKVVEDFETDVLHGVVDTHDATHVDSLSRVEAVMSQAATVQVSGPLSVHARVPVKQGVCHHFANEDRLKWRK